MIYRELFSLYTSLVKFHFSFQRRDILKKNDNKSTFLRHPRLIIAIFVLFSITSLNACSFGPRLARPVNLGEEIFYKLASPESLKGEQSVVRQLLYEKEDQRYSTLIQLEVDAQALTLVGFTPLNTRAFSLIFDGRTIDSRVGRFSELPVDPIELISNLQLALWPRDIIANQFGSEAEIVESLNDSGKLRICSVNHTEVARITFEGEDPWKSSVHIENMVNNYQITLKAP